MIIDFSSNCYCVCMWTFALYVRVDIRLTCPCIIKYVLIDKYCACADSAYEDFRVVKLHFLYSYIPTAMSRFKSSAQCRHDFVLSDGFSFL